MFPDLPSVEDDVKWLEEAISKYGHVDFGPDNMFRMLDGPSRKTMDAARAKLKELLQKNKHKKVLVAYIFAGHGIVESGSQTVVLNDFKKSEGFYWRY